MYASKKNYKELVKILLSAGADVNLQTGYSVCEIYDSYIE